MSRTKRWVLILAALPLLLLAVAFLIGFLTPREHQATSAASYPVPPDSVWTVITGFEEMPSWRPDLRSVTPGEAPDTWIEEGLTGKLTYEVTLREPPQKLGTRISDPDLPFGGSWFYAVTPEGAGSRLTITEEGEIRPAMFRFMARYLFGYHSTMDSYLTALGERFGVEVLAEHMETGNR